MTTIHPAAHHPRQEHSVPWFWPYAAAIELGEEGMKLFQENLRYVAEAEEIAAPPQPRWVQWIFRENRLAKGQFVGLGERLSSKDIVCPVYLLAGSEDEITTKEQVFNAKRYLGTPKGGNRRETRIRWAHRVVHGLEDPDRMLARRCALEPMGRQAPRPGMNEASAPQ